MKTPRTALEALYAEILGDLTTIIERVEAFPAKLDTATAQLADTSQRLESASEKFRASVGSFTDSARQALAVQLEAKASETVKAITDELRNTIQTEAQRAFQAEVTTEVGHLTAALRTAAEDLKRSRRSRLAEAAGIACASSAMTALVVALLLRMH